MSSLKTYPLQNSAILRINAERDAIKVDPEYQRQGEVWNLEKKQLLIDSILNDYDIPKLYFHHLMQWYANDFDQDRFRYAVIDGRQRLEAIWDFVDGKFCIGNDFKYLEDPSVLVGGLTYTGLAEKAPKLKVRFDSFALPVVLVETDDIDLIEDMFSRLNEAVPLNAAEKRNAFGGAMAAGIRVLAEHALFQSKVRFGNGRYQFREVAARLLLLELHLGTEARIVDTKKASLDEMVRIFHGAQNEVDGLLAPVRTVLDALVPKFVNNDVLLRSQSVIPVIYLVARELLVSSTFDGCFDRQRITAFYDLLAKNRFVASRRLEIASFELLEFDRLSQQGTNDASSIKFRYELLLDFLVGKRGDIESRVIRAYDALLVS